MANLSTSSVWTTFQTPACQVDFSNPTDQARLDDLWNKNLQGFTLQGITGNPWTTTNSSDQTIYFNPTAPITGNGAYAQIQWSPVPGRIGYYFPNMSDDDIWSLADTAQDTAGKTFAPITTDPCDPTATQTKPYGPYGPRGWQDEYCEWSVQRDANDNIVRIDFTCENPEYWNSLWLIDPQTVLDIYRSTLDNTQIALDDLCLLDSNGNIVIDPSTGRPAYNPLNEWNSGPVSTDAGGGAMHLTSTPNTLQTEIGLASTATTPRAVGNANAGTLICCAQYGQPGRNSDPHIGQSVNQLVTPLNPASASSMVTLANPPGLYIQMPDFGRISGPPGVDVQKFWTVKRGQEALHDAAGNLMPGNFILHATFQAPPGVNCTISDLQVDQIPVKWAAQIAQTFEMQIVGMALPLTPKPAQQACAGSPSAPSAQALQLFHAAIFDAMAATNIANPVGQAMTLLSNSTMIAPIVQAGQTDVPLVLVVAGVNPGQIPSVSFGPGIDVTVAGSMTPITYAVPGNTYPSTNFALPITVSIDASAASGLRDCLVNNPGGPASTIPMPALLHVA
jgi:hypothetical protein